MASLLVASLFVASLFSGSRGAQRPGGKREQAEYSYEQDSCEKPMAFVSMIHDVRSLCLCLSAGTLDLKCNDAASKSRDDRAVGHCWSDVMVNGG